MRPPRYCWLVGKSKQKFDLSDATKRYFEFEARSARATTRPQLATHLLHPCIEQPVIDCRLQPEPRVRQGWISRPRDPVTCFRTVTAGAAPLLA
jgi:hypothetical protein